MINDIYKDRLLKHPLSDKEYKLVNKVWEWIDEFNKPTLFVSEYRKNMINSMKSKYNIREFQKYEEIAEKLFWNLRWLLFPLFYYPNMRKDDYERFVRDNYKDHENLPHGLLLCNITHYRNKEEMKEKIKENKLLKQHYYRSFVNKIFVIDSKTKRIIFKPMEGSSEIFAKNYFNLLTSVILSNKNLYEIIMSNPYSINKIKIDLPEFYYEYDYAFPNLNFCMFKVGTDKDRKFRIKKMYYDKEAEKYWFKLLVI